MKHALWVIGWALALSLGVLAFPGAWPLWAIVVIGYLLVLSRTSTPIDRVDRDRIHGLIQEDRRRARAHGAPPVWWDEDVLDNADW